MRSILCALVCVLLPLASVSAQTAVAEVAIGAELEVLPRSVDLGVLPGPDPYTTLELEPETETAAAMRSATTGELILATIGGDDEDPILLNTMFARAYARAAAGDDAARAKAIAAPAFDLVNALDEPMLLRLLVRIPSAFPTPAGPVPSEFFDRGSVANSAAEVARTEQFVVIIPSWGTDPVVDIMRPVALIRATRDPLVAGPPEPAAFDTFGVPFATEYRIAVPPSYIQIGDTLELRLHTLTLWVKAEALAVSVLDSVTKPVIFKGLPPLCELAPPVNIAEALGYTPDPLCRAGRNGAARPPICNCTRDDAARGQRCAFLFSDFVVAQQLPTPPKPGEQVNVEWAIQPLTDGEYWLAPEIYVDGKWMPVQTKGKLGGKLAEGKEARAKLAFTMPSRPTILRTRMFHLPNGAKQPIESQIDTIIPMRKVKAQ